MKLINALTAVQTNTGVMIVQIDVGHVIILVKLVLQLLTALVVGASTFCTLIKLAIKLALIGSMVKLSVGQPTCVVHVISNVRNVTDRVLMNAYNAALKDLLLTFSSMGQTNAQLIVQQANTKIL